LDLSQELLLDFRLNGDCDAPLVRGDMRQVPHRDGVFDVVLSLFTSFGYFEESEDDWQVVREIARVLRPGGRFVLDFLNALRVRADLRPHSERELASGVRVTESRRIDADRKRVVKTVELRRGGELLRRWHEAVRLHTRPEIERALHDTGFIHVRAFGDFDASPHGEASPRLILVATRA
jgi:SAM-dependent methyltransferase